MSDEELAEFYLHSTMYLLNLMCYDNTDNLVKDLHSTMYLLNRGRIVFIKFLHQFTFHYVSIKSGDSSLATNADSSIYIPLCIY